MSPITPESLLARAQATQQTHSPQPLMPALSTPKTILISCADPRVNPEKIFSLIPDDGVIVFRTIAGHPQPIFSGILALDVALKTITNVWVLHHTDCGSTYWTEEGVRKGLTERCPGHEKEIGEMVFGAVGEGLETNLRNDVVWLRAQPLMRPELTQNVRGFMYDIETGELKDVA